MTERENRTLFDSPERKLNTIQPKRMSAEADQPRLCRQALKIYYSLRRGPVRTSELAAIAVQYNARLKEIRDFLRPEDLTVDRIERGHRGNNLYAIRPFHGSNYERELMIRQIKNRKSKGVALRMK